VTGPRRLALQGWIVIGLLVLILLGIVGIGLEMKFLPVTRRTPTWRDDDGTAEGTRRPAYRSTGVSNTPAEARPNTIAQGGIDKNLNSISWAGLSPWAEAKPCVIWSRLGSSRTSRTRDARHPKRAGYLCCTLPDELEGVQAVYATDGLNDEEIYWSVFFSRPKTDKERYFLERIYLPRRSGVHQIVHWPRRAARLLADPMKSPGSGKPGL
jgi:hypothetical protein